MALKIILTILVMLAAFLLVCGFLTLVAAMFSEEHRRICGNCVHYDRYLDCCREQFRGRGRKESCKNFRRAAKL